MAPKKSNAAKEAEEANALLKKMSKFVELYQLQKESKVKDGNKDISYYTDIFIKQIEEEQFLHKIFKYGFTDDEINKIFEDPVRFYAFSNNLRTYRAIYDKFITDFKKDRVNMSKYSEAAFSDVASYYKENKETYNISLNNLRQYRINDINLKSVEDFIENTVNTSFIKTSTEYIIGLINDIIKHNPKTVTLPIILNIYKLTRELKLNSEIQNTIIMLLKAIFSICETIKYDYSVVSLRQKKNTGMLLQRLPIQNNLGNSSLIKHLYVRTTTEVDIETEFDLENNKIYILGRYNLDTNANDLQASDVVQNSEKIPVFSTIYPHVENFNHAKLTTKEYKIHIQHISNDRNGTYIIRDKETIDLTSYINSGTHELYHNDVICIGYPEPKVSDRDPKITKFLSDLDDKDPRKNDKKYEINDARYHVYIEKPTTLMLYGCIPCSVVDVHALINCVNEESATRNKFIKCIDDFLIPQHFVNPTKANGGGSQYITIGGRRRKIHIQKGKQYVNYKSELILVTKLKKLLKSEK
jgi:hypothetical protein